MDLNRSSYAEDINKKYYPNMPELLSDVFQNKRADRSVSFSTKDDENKAVALMHKNRNEESIPIHTSVRDTIKFIEKTFKPHPLESKAMKLMTTNREEIPTMKNNETQTDAAEGDKNEDDGMECLNKASESIQKLEKEFPKIRYENFPMPTPKKITTKVTLNVQKITHMSETNNGLMKDQTRHSICNNAEIIKRLQMHFKGKEMEKNDLISSSCSSLVPAKDGGGGECSGEKHNKFFCRNCGFIMQQRELEMMKDLTKGYNLFTFSSKLWTILYGIERKSSGYSI